MGVLPKKFNKDNSLERIRKENFNMKKTELLVIVSCILIVAVLLSILAAIKSFAVGDSVVVTSDVKLTYDWDSPKILKSGCTAKAGSQFVIHALSERFGEGSSAPTILIAWVEPKRPVEGTCSGWVDIDNLVKIEEEE